MKHAVIIDDELYPQFKNDIGGVTVIVADKNGGQSELTAFPLVRPMILAGNGNAAYLPPGHIECLMEHEREQAYRFSISRFPFANIEILNRKGENHNGKYSD